MSTSIAPKKLMFPLCAGEMCASTWGQAGMSMSVVLDPAGDDALAGPWTSPSSIEIPTE